MFPISVQPLSPSHAEHTAREVERGKPTAFHEEGKRWSLGHLMPTEPLLLKASPRQGVAASASTRARRRKQWPSSSAFFLSQRIGPPKSVVPSAGSTRAKKLPTPEARSTSGQAEEWIRTFKETMLPQTDLRNPKRSTMESRGTCRLSSHLFTDSLKLRVWAFHSPSVMRSLWILTLTTPEAWAAGIGLARAHCHAAASLGVPKDNTCKLHTFAKPLALVAGTLTGVLPSSCTEATTEIVTPSLGAWLTRKAGIASHTPITMWSPEFAE